MADEEKKAQGKAQNAAAFGGSLVGAERVTQEAAATDAWVDGLKLFLKKAEAKTPPDKLRGNLFEYIEAAKFNMDAARQGKSFRAHVTAETPGRGTDPKTDIEIRYGSGKKVLKKYQSKVSSDPNRTAREISDPKYDGVEKHVLKDQADYVRKKTVDKNVNVDGELEHSGVSSDGTSERELNSAVNTKSDPNRSKSYAYKAESRQVACEAHVTGWQAAKAGTVIGAALSFVKNADAYIQGDVDGQEAMKNVAKDTAKAGVRSYSTGALGTGIRYGAKKGGVQALTKPDVAFGIAAGLIGAGCTVYSYAKGEISAKEAVERLGNTGCSTIAGITAGAILVGPAGPIAGYLLAESVYTSCIVIIKEAQLAEKEAERIEDLCIEAAKIRVKEREQFKAAMANYMGENQAAFDECFEAIDQALVTDQPIEAIHALSNLTIRFGKELKLADFKDFDEFMTESDEPLVL